MNRMDWLPKEHNLKSYISSCLELLEEWKWLFEERNTDILKAELLDKPPALDILPFISQLEVDELNNVPYGFVKDDWPDAVKNFVRKCDSLRLNIPKYDISCKIETNRNMFRQMNPKKQMEVLQLSALTAEICLKNNIKHVIDFGSGLGYVDRLLCRFYGLFVLGLEKDSEKVNKARAMGEGVDYRDAYLADETMPDIKETIANWLQGSSACFIALHGCGDLSILIGRLFGELSEAKVLILVPCCYHRSTLRPMSPEIKSSGLVNTTLLRLASDATAERWRLTTALQHLAHSRSVLARAIIQIFPSDESVKIKKKHRHLLRTAAQENWGKCLDKCVQGFSGVDTEKLQEAWKSNEWRLNQIESYSCLQVCLQAVAEGLILIDTLVFLMEETKATVQLMRIFDAVVSPRSVAFVVTRREGSRRGTSRVLERGQILKSEGLKVAYKTYGSLKSRLSRTKGHTFEEICVSFLHEGRKRRHLDALERLEITKAKKRTSLCCYTARTVDSVSEILEVVTEQEVTSDDSVEGGII